MSLKKTDLLSFETSRDNNLGTLSDFVVSYIRNI
eukprot:UN19580